MLWYQECVVLYRMFLDASAHQAKRIEKLGTHSMMLWWKRPFQSNKDIIKYSCIMEETAEAVYGNFQICCRKRL